METQLEQVRAQTAELLEERAQLTAALANARAGAAEAAKPAKRTQSAGQGSGGQQGGPARRPEPPRWWYGQAGPKRRESDNKSYVKLAS